MAKCGGVCTFWGLLYLSRALVCRGSGTLARVTPLSCCGLDFRLVVQILRYQIWKAQYLATLRQARRPDVLCQRGTEVSFSSGSETGPLKKGAGAPLNLALA